MIELFLIATTSCRNITATYYHDWYEGRRMANGEIFRQNSNSAASNDYPLGTRLRITRNGRTITVVVRDRMARSGVIDLSRRSFSELGNVRQGVIPVRVCR